MVDHPRRRTERAPSSLAHTTVPSWPSARDIPQRLRVEASDWPEQRSNDNSPDRATETLYSIGEVQEWWGVSDTTLYREIRAGKLRANKVGGQWRISESAMVRYRKSNEPPLRLPGHPPRSRRSS